MSVILNAGALIGQPNAALQIRTGSRDVIAAGTVITADSRNLEFQLAHLRFVFEFSTDGGSPRIEFDAPGTSALNLRLYNFSSSIGSGTTSPIEIGTLAGRKLLLAFVVYALSPESSKTVHYTFMAGEPT
ncbi:MULTISPECIES: DUF6864 domain-containing function [Burkholderia]|uniref:Uncharacterized protein n=1 Tax=Burkholderia contaminans TaxID=488447 RepID=A0A2S5DWU6_9BURK|nr:MULTISPECIES: hypothetical protein [Burkholderia]EKS9798474.1 hypothetical protein [Burkholderia cepacia]EKS9807530.1 hypothetical protein [Burkholderia cepacia]EKS9815089.1 hypothetical protein [Burkholderia cepacia]EKS9821032.1 hypothetical protein [Burkholderia cepacia]EKS9827778.1 hypothetical protein [Burkholderia cepacia]